MQSPLKDPLANFLELVLGADCCDEHGKSGQRSKLCSVVRGAFENFFGMHGIHFCRKRFAGLSLNLVEFEGCAHDASRLWRGRE